MATTTKAAAVTVVAAAVTTAVVVLPREEEMPAPPPPRELVAEKPPEPTPPPPPARVVPPKPAPPSAPPRKPEPPPAPRAPTGLDLLAGHFEGRAGAEALLWDFERLERLLAAPAARPVRIMRAGEVSLEKLAGAATSIEFGPGVFHLVRDGWKQRTVRGNRAALEIKGAGMDQTTLLCGHRDLLMIVGSVDSIRLSGFTLDGAALLDVRGQAAALVQDVRVRGWTTGAGYGAPIGHSGRLLLAARNCDFVGGYKRVAGGHALAPRGEVLALFDRCRFSGLSTVLAGAWKGGSSRRSLAYLRDCEFVNCRLVNRRFQMNGRPVFPLRVRGGTIRYRASHLPGESRIERWSGGQIAELEGGRFEAGVSRCTLGDLWKVLESFAPARGERIAGVHALVWDRAPLEYFAVHLASRDTERTILVRREGDRLEEITEPAFALPRFPVRSEVYEGPDLVRVLRSVESELDFAVEARAVREEALNGRDGPVPAVYVVDALGNRLLYVQVDDLRIRR
jgi:hypothetical protein